jgi:galactose mutarotase-like enzyme
MTLELENEYLYVAMDSKGAELTRVLNKETGRDILWDANPAFWGKTSPVLFPIVGALKDDTYFYNGEFYSLPRHGFARDREFTVEEAGKDKVVFLLKDDGASRLVYPFAFEFRIVYNINSSVLSCTYEITNPSDTDLYASVGGHPAFKVDTAHGLDYADYYLEFDKDEELRYFPLVDNAIGEASEILPLQNGRLPLSYELFYKDALVIKDLKSDVIRLRNCKTEGGIDFHFEGFPFFGIWAAKDADFVCLEPWCGVADGVNHNQELSTKEGIKKLEAGGVFERSWRVEVG